MNSIQGGLTVRLLGSLVAVFLFQWLLVSYAIHRVAENYVLSRLEHDAESLLVALSITGEDAPTVDTTRLNPVYYRPFSGHYYHVILPQTALRSRSLWDEDLDLGSEPLARDQHRHTPGPQGQHLLVLVRRYRKQGVPVTVALAEDLTPIERDILGFWTRYALLTFAMLAVLVILQRRTVRRALRPLAQAQANLAHLDRGQIKELDENVPAEIRPLVREINWLVRITGERLTRSRNALGNLAHALKTPLTVLTQLTKDKTLQADPDLVRRLEKQTDTLRDLTERQLRHARLAGEGTPGACFAVAAELSDLIEALEHIYQEKRLDIQSQIPSGLTFAADREDMLELTGNLLDNACKWARDTVRVSVESDHDFKFKVEDDGPGAPPEALSRLTQRGVRLDESTDGHGLGLAIACDIVQHYGGTMRFGRSELLGGFLVQLHLPAAERGSGV